MAMLTQSTAPSLNVTRIAPGGFAPSAPFCGLAGRGGLIATEFTYRKDEEIYEAKTDRLRRRAGGADRSPDLGTGYCAR